MATRYWLGAADVVMQVSTVQITADDAATTYTITIGNISVSVAGAGTGVNATASALQTALAASTHPYFSDVAWTVSTDTVTGTGNGSGAPFTAASSVTGGTGTIGAVTEATAPVSPHHYDHADNWSGNTVPTTNDTVVVPAGTVPILWGLDQSGTAINDFFLEEGYTGYIGLNPHRFHVSTSSEVSQAEYRESFLTLDVDRIEIRGEPSRCNIDNANASASTCQILNTGSASKDVGFPAVDYVCNHASSELHISGAPGGVGAGAKRATDACTLGTISFTPNSAQASFVGRRLTITNWYQRGGTATLEAAANITLAEVNAGTLTTLGSGWLFTTMDVFGGTWRPMHQGSTNVIATTLTVWEGGVVDFNRDRDAKTVTTIKLYPSSAIHIDAHVTFTNFTWMDQAALLTFNKDA